MKTLTGYVEINLNKKLIFALKEIIKDSNNFYDYYLNNCEEFYEEDDMFFCKKLIPNIQKLKEEFSKHLNVQYTISNKEMYVNIFTEHLSNIVNLFEVKGTDTVAILINEKAAHELNTTINFHNLENLL